MTDKPFAGCIAMLEGMIEDGSLDRFNDLADQRKTNAKDLVLTVYQDGNFNVQRGVDAVFEAGAVPDYVTSIPVATVLAAIAEASK